MLEKKSEYDVPNDNNTENKFIVSRALKVVHYNKPVLTRMITNANRHSDLLKEMDEFFSCTLVSS